MTRALEATGTRPSQPAAPRSPHVIGILVQPAECGACGAAGPGNPCVRRADGVEGTHMARYAAARRRNLITSEEFGAVIWAAGTFGNATVVYDETFGQAAL